MKSYNYVNLIGRAVKDAEVRYTTTGKPVGSFTIAVDRTYKDSSGNYPTDFFRISVWSKLAEICGEYVTKGILIQIAGKLQNRKYEKNGETRYSTDIVAEKVNILSNFGNKDTNSTTEPQDNVQQNYTEDDVPF